MSLLDPDPRLLDGVQFLVNSVGFRMVCLRKSLRHVPTRGPCAMNKSNRVNRILPWDTGTQTDVSVARPHKGLRWFKSGVSFRRISFTCTVFSFGDFTWRPSFGLGWFPNHQRGFHRWPPNLKLPVSRHGRFPNMISGKGC